MTTERWDLPIGEDGDVANQRTGQWQKPTTERVWTWEEDDAGNWLLGVSRERGRPVCIACQETGGEEARTFIIDALNAAEKAKVHLAWVDDLGVGTDGQVLDNGKRLDA